MKKKATTKPARRREHLTWSQIDSMSRAVAVDLMMSEVKERPALMLLLQEVAEHPFDASHVEGVVNTLLDHLFTCTVESDIAFKAFIERERRKLKGEVTT